HRSRPRHAHGLAPRPACPRLAAARLRLRALSPAPAGLPCRAVDARRRRAPRRQRGPAAVDRRHRRPHRADRRALAAARERHAAVARGLVDFRSRARARAGAALERRPVAKRSHALKDHWREQRLFVSRVVAAAVFVLLLTSVLVGRLVNLQVVDYQRFGELSQDNRLRIEPLAPTRGLIFDRNGLVIAANLPTWQRTAVTEKIPDLVSMLHKLETLALLDPAEHSTLVELIRSHRRFERVKLRNLTETEASRFAVRRPRFPGIDIQEGLVRYYPFGPVSAHAVGYVGSISSSDLERIDRRDYAAT